MSAENNIERQEKIRRYLLELLNSEEQKMFEQQMESDSELREEVALEKSLLQAMNDNDWDLADPQLEQERIKELRSELDSDTNKELSTLIKDVGNEYRLNKNIRTSKRRWYSIVAACGIVLLSVISYFMMQPTDMQSYYAVYANWNELPSSIVQDETVSPLVKGELLYNEKKYKEAVVYYTDLLKNAKEDDIPSALMYLGASYTELEEYEKALETFDALAKSNTIDSSRGYWYQLLVYLKQERLEDVKKMIGVITADNNNYNYQQALELSKKLN